MSQPKKFENDIDFQSRSLIDVAIDPRALAPTSPVIGQHYYDATVGHPFVWDGTQWTPYASPSIGASVKITNTDTTTNINSTAVTDFDEMWGVAQWNDGSLYSINFTLEDLTINETGRYRFDFYFSYIESSGSTARQNLRTWVELDGVQISPNYQNNYLRDASGHNETGQGGSLVFEATAGQVLKFFRQRISGGTGAIVLQGTNNFMYLERIA